jgi:hypothetical protein
MNRVVSPASLKDRETILEAFAAAFNWSTLQSRPGFFTTSSE